MSTFTKWHSLPHLKKHRTSAFSIIMYANKLLPLFSLNQLWPLNSTSKAYKSLFHTYTNKNIDTFSLLSTLRLHLHKKRKEKTETTPWHTRIEGENFQPQKGEQMKKYYKMLPKLILPTAQVCTVRYHADRTRMH